VPSLDDDLFHALADPTRRRILDLLAERGPLTVGELASNFPDLVPSGISKHLMGLRAAGLVRAVRKGRQRLYEIDGEALSAAVAPWLRRYEPYWSRALARLRDLSEGRQPSPGRDHGAPAPRGCAARTNRSAPSAAVVPVLTYPDVGRAVQWLTEAFGFLERVRVGENHRAQLRFGDGDLIVADVSGDRRPPRPGEVTTSVMVRVPDARAHCERARAHGARILMEPRDMPYGERQYNAEDPFGHIWTFTETIFDAAPEDWGGETISD